MPRRVGGSEHYGWQYKTLEEQLSRGDGGQREWYKIAGGLVRGYTVMDVGAGNGYGMKIMEKAGALEVSGIDPYPGRDVEYGRGEEILGFYDWITCMDVIEHIEDDEEHPDRKDKYFLKHILEHARIGIFLSTPNWDTYHAGNLLHYREYTPNEMRDLLEGLDYDIWNYDSAYPPKRVETFEECQQFGVTIWKNRSNAAPQ